MDKSGNFTRFGQWRKKMNIKREQYLNELIVRKHNTLIKIITGIRRCGKSYLLNTIFYDHLFENYYF